MSGYLSVQNFWKYQDKNAWKKAKTHPPWFKHYVNRDRDLDALPPLARLLFHELLGAATRHSNVLEADPNWLWAETRVPVEAIVEMLPLLLKGGWLSQTKTKRRGTATGTQKQPGSDVQDVDVEEEVKDKDLDLELALNPPDVTAAAETFVQAVAIDPKGREHRPYYPPRDPLNGIRLQIARGVIADEVALAAELRAHPSITQTDRESLRDLLTVKAGTAA